MSEFSKFSWEREEPGTMESCYKLYTWINHTVLMLIFQIFWKVNQISNYFNRKSIEENKDEFSSSPLTKESKYRRHIRSMSDVQNSTPCRLPYRSMGHHVLSYDSDTRTRRIRTYNRHRQVESSDSSDNETPKQKSLGHHILKHTDSMRIL